MSVKKIFLVAAVCATSFAVFSCKKFKDNTKVVNENVPGYEILALEDEEPINMVESSVVAYAKVPESENPDVKFGFFLSNNPSIPAGGRTEVIWETKMPTDRYESAFKFTARFRNLDCTKTYYYQFFYVLDNEYRLSESRSFIPGCIDLGEGLRFAVCNLGASDKYAYGGYYAWGETSPKTAFTLDNYVGNTTCVAGNLHPSYDAASVQFGGKWRMPSADELRKLCDQDLFDWSTDAGCFKLTSKISGYEGRSIFLPKGGMVNDILDPSGTGNMGKGNSVSYMSTGHSLLGANDCCYLLFYSGSGPIVKTDYAYYGYSVRPILGI